MLSTTRDRLKGNREGEMEWAQEKPSISYGLKGMPKRFISKTVGLFPKPWVIWSFPTCRGNQRVIGAELVCRCFLEGKPQTVHSQTQDSVIPYLSQQQVDVGSACTGGKVVSLGRSIPRKGTANLFGRGQMARLSFFGLSLKRNQKDTTHFGGSTIWRQNPSLCVGPSRVLQTGKEHPLGRRVSGKGAFVSFSVSSDGDSLHRTLLWTRCTSPLASTAWVACGL